MSGPKLRRVCSASAACPRYILENHDHMEFKTYLASPTVHSPDATKNVIHCSNVMLR